MIFEGTKNKFFFGLGLTRAGTTLPTVDNLIVLATILHVHMEDILVVDNVINVSETKVSENSKIVIICR